MPFTKLGAVREVAVDGSQDPVLSVRDIVVEFGPARHPLRAIRGVSFDLYRGETLGIVGESASGKSITMLAIMGLLPPEARLVSGSAILNGVDLIAMKPRARRRHLGRDIAMVFQDPMTTLNPVLSIGRQLVTAIRVHDRSVSAPQAKQRAADLLTSVGVPDASARLDQYPHQFSGGMRQRVVIAMALANRPSVVIADEPTTALDVTIQAQVLDVLRDIAADSGTSVIVITHDLGVIAELSDEVAVMYAGRVVERAPVIDLFDQPLHPYTEGLMNSRPSTELVGRALTPIPGQPPTLRAIGPGCSFEPRCHIGHGREECRTVRPDMRGIDGVGRMTACHLAEKLLDGATSRSNRPPAPRPSDGTAHDAL